jgi:hypothetical protein
MSVALRDRLRPLDFRYHPRATGDVWRHNMSRRAKTGCEQSQQTISLFDHLVGAGEQRWRQSEAKRLGGLEVHHQLDFGWLQHW